MCESMQSEIQSKFRDEQFTQRTVSSHKTNVAEINKTRNSKTKHFKGVKNENCLAPLEYFHVIKGLPPDIMHDFQEGNLMKGFTMLILKLQDLRLYNIGELNADLKSFKYSRNDAKNKIPFNLFLESKTQLKLSASHALTLCIVFPIIIGDRFVGSAGQEYYEHFISLIEIFRKLCDDTFVDYKINDLSDKIEIYLKEFR